MRYVYVCQSDDVIVCQSDDVITIRVTSNTENAGQKSSGHGHERRESIVVFRLPCGSVVDLEETPHKMFHSMLYCIVTVLHLCNLMYV